MLAIDHPYTIVLIASVIISLSLAVAVLIQRRTLGAYAFASLKAAIGLWAFSSLFEVGANYVQIKIFAYSAKYLFIVLVPITWFVYGLYYSNRLRKLTPGHIVMLAIVPAITMLMVATNQYHHWMFTTLEFIETDSNVFIVRKFGPWFWIHAGYSYILLYLGFFFMGKHLIDAPTHYRWQVATLLIGGLTPWVANIAFTLDLTSYPYLDLTPFAFTISGVAFMIGIVRFQLLDVVPIAQEVVFENINDAIIVLDSEQRVVDFNPTAKRLASPVRGRLIGTHVKNVFQWWHQIDLGQAPFSDSDPPIVEVNMAKRWRLFRPKIVPLECNGRKNGHLITLQDVTEEHELQCQLFQSQKMEAIGTLAGGIAHDFNNLLMGMQANLSLMHIGNSLDPAMKEKIRRIENQIQTGANLTRQLLGYARKGKYIVTAVNLNRLIEEALAVVERTNKAIRIKRLFSDKPLYIKGDQGQMELVLLNLFVNALDAMPEGGSLTVSTQRIGRPEGLKNTGHHDRYCEIRVTDTGIGIDPATQKRIFEPFFTTKEVGQGTGLGLASVYGVIQNHDGRIQVESSKGQETTFTINLPIIPKPVQQEECRKTNDPPPQGGKILLVDDEPLILKYTGEMIQSLDFEVLPASNGREAIEIYEKQHGDIDLVILDMIMPGMDGLGVYRALNQINPGLRVIVTSGNTSHKRLEAILSDGCHGCLKKPYTRGELMEEISTMLAIAN